MSIYIYNFLTMYMIFAAMIQSQQQLDLDDEVQVIDPLVISQKNTVKNAKRRN
jgi:hypothetical protein